MFICIIKSSTMKTSFQYYSNRGVHQLKKRNNNLNYNTVELNYLEVKLEQFLDASFKLLHPLFSDGNDKIEVKDHVYHKEKLDDDFDSVITTNVTRYKWVVMIIGLFYKLYCFVFRIKPTLPKDAIVKNSYKKPNNSSALNPPFIKNKRFSNTSPP